MAQIPDSLAFRPFMRLPSVDTTPLSMVVSGYRLVIPRNDLFTAFKTNYSQGENYVVLAIQITFPEFRGPNAANLSAFMSPLWGHPEIISAYNVQNYGPGAKQVEALQIERAREIAGRSESGGFVWLPKNDADTWYNGVELPLGNERAIVVSCIPSPPLPGVRANAVDRCTVELPLRPSFSPLTSELNFLYEFDRSLIPRIRDVDNGMHSLLNSYVKGVAQ